jgi:hypothetical protein
MPLEPLRCGVPKGSPKLCSIAPRPGPGLTASTAPAEEVADSADMGVGEGGTMVGVLGGLIVLLLLSYDNIVGD